LNEAASRQLIAKIYPILRGWVNYFRVSHSSNCFGAAKRWVEEEGTAAV
jgi:group II intron maturase